MKNRILVAAAIILALGGSTGFCAEARVGGRVLIVCDERAQMELLADFLRTTGGLEVEIVGKEDFPPETRGLRAIFNFVHRTHSERVEKALIDYAIGGGRLISLHHAIASAKTRNKHWLGFCGIALLPRALGPDRGGWYVVGNTTAELVNLAPDHFVTTHKVRYQKMTSYRPSDFPSVEQRLPALEFPRSEVFLNQHFTDGRQKRVLFGVKCVDPRSGRTYMQDRGGWYQPVGRGWHFYFQIGHATSDFMNRSYCRVLYNSVTWRPPK